MSGIVSFDEQRKRAIENRKAALNQMSIVEYFQQPDTPGSDSPIGALMVRVIGKNPGMSFEKAREEAHRLLDKAACRRVYGIPRVLSAEEQEKEKVRLRQAFGSPARVPEPRKTVRRDVSRCSVATNSPKLDSWA